MCTYLIFVVFLGQLFLPMESSSFTHKPRVTLTEKDVNFSRIDLQEHNTHIIFLQSHKVNSIYAAGNRHLYQADFHSLFPSRLINSSVFGAECNDPGSPECQYNLTVLHKSKYANQLFLCGTDGGQTLCRDSSLDSTLDFTQSKAFPTIDLPIKETEPTLLINSSGIEDLYTTLSGTGISVGIHRFGNSRIWTENGATEQIYLSLVASGNREDKLQDRLYAFYIKKNTDQAMNSDLWVPMVAQVCMADRGGPKTYLQFRWTSKLSSRLFCGDPERKLFFSHLVDVNTVEADRWNETRVYALFRNVWGMSAVCVYTTGEIDNIFQTSNFKGYTQKIPEPRPGQCVQDSTKLDMPVLTIVDKNSEMEESVGKNKRPLLITKRHYNHISVDRVQGKGNVLFLSLDSGMIHKVLERDDRAFFIAELQPFNRRTHILSMMLHSSTKKLYVGSSNELVQIDLASCKQYGNKCEDCVLARDPYCGWNGDHCTTATDETIQDVDEGNPDVCLYNARTSKYRVVSGTSQRGSAKIIKLPLFLKYFLKCPTISSYANYSWMHFGNAVSTPCTFTEPERQCLLLIESMGPEQVGTYTCVSEESGYKQTLAEYQLLLDSGATSLALHYLAFLCLIVMLVLIPSAQL
ncbi:hypothetical protein UPYG_G00083520 [Umbra pygmaea]|uniref:Sema domain-containing protein n=1 Tax=Umbra pygmaea TaxID=75934 RepID=A0ABD0XE73_UMBPY